MIYIELIIVILLGCLMGVATGLTPGLHINLVSVILLSLSPLLLNYTSAVPIACFIIAMSITHTFTDFISATYLGAPSDDTALAVLPAHRLLLNGMGHEAIRFTTIGSLICLIAVIILSPLLIHIVPFIFDYVKNYVGWLLLAVVIFMILRESTFNKKFWALVVVLLSGTLGLIVLSIPNLKEPLLPMLSGLFGISVLAVSLAKKAVLPKQRTTEMIKLKAKNTFKAVASGVFSGSLVSIFPGLGPAQAAVIAGQIDKKINQYSYLILVGGINTVSMLLSLITLYSIQKARNGSIIAVQHLLDKIDMKLLVLFMAVALLAGGIATFLTLFTSRIFSSLMNKINYSILTISIIIFISSIAFYFSGFIGLIILITSTAIGLVPNVVDVSRSNSMACLILPIIIVNLI